MRNLRAVQLGFAVAFTLITTSAFAQGVIKLGMVGEFSGPFAQYGQQMLGGMKAYMMKVAPCSSGGT